MAAHSEPECLIVGAGPTGLTAAIELARRGIPLRIIDNDGLPTPESRALAIHARTLDILEPAGVTEQLIAAGNRVNGMIICNGGRERFRLDLSRLPHRFNFILTLPQSETETIMIDHLKTCGVEIGWHTEFTGFEPAGAGFNCSTAGGAAIEADILIGADGAHSLVRETLGLDFDGESLPQEFGLADVELDDWPYPFDHAVAFLGGGNVRGCFPLGEGACRFVSNHPDVLNRLPPEARVKRIGWQSTFRISYRQVSSYQKGNAFLAGDAAHIHSPVGGRGMNLGIEDAGYLAWLISTGETARYTACRHATGAKVLKFTEAQTRQITSDSLWSDVVLNWIAPLVLKLPFVERMGLSRLTGLDTPRPPWLE